MNREVAEDCMAIAFYGVQADAETLGAFYAVLIDWFNAAGCPPDKLSVDGSGFGGKPVPFGNADKRLRKKGFSGVDSFDVYAMLPKGTTPTVDWWATASLSLDYKPSFFVQARRSLASLEEPSVSNFVEKCVAALTPVYGIAYYRDHSRGPGFYAIGLNYVTPDNVIGDDPEELEAVSKWGYVGLNSEVYRDGVIRDVYPYNYLTDPHLKMQVHGKTLESWISSDDSRGTLHKIGDQMMVWQVGSEQVESVRSLLAESGIIFDWNKYEED